jgi:NADH-quinone oxidoreductase subunit L
MDPSSLLPTLLGLAVLLPLGSFFVILLCAQWLGKSGAYLAVSAIGGAAVLSFISFFVVWLPNHWPTASHHGEHHGAEHHESHEGHEHHEPHATPHTEPGHSPSDKSDTHPPAEKHSSTSSYDLSLVAFQTEAHSAPATEGSTSAALAASDKPVADKHAAGPPYTGEFYTLGQFGPLRLTISYYIDALTIGMFCMVTLIATLIHCYAIGYMSDELTADYVDHEVTDSHGRHLHRPGRFPRFFQYLSLFCFSMLGLVLAGNIAMVFVFWELVGICSYFLIGFYIERQSASNAANKAFIVNRVGDFGMIIGLMALWSTLGTFAFGDLTRTNADGSTTVEPGIFSLVRPEPNHALIVPDGMVQADAQEQLGQDEDGQPIMVHAVGAIVRDHAHMENGQDLAASEIAARTPAWREKGYGYWLLVVAGLGIFCGCVGKSAQFPLHVWLPDAMEGPTPVSALVHSATMVAAGVYLVGRFFPVFAPEVLLVIASAGCITMLLGATIAFTAVDIKRVLAYSTVSQLGLMMLALGVGGWAAGLMHLITHAFFKSMLFMCSGSVIHAVHTNDMRKMGGLFRKMPVTAITMLIGCLAIAGVAVPFVVGFSGHYSKDAILEQAMSFWNTNKSAWSGTFFVLALGGAAMTTTYMFRMWFMTFVGQPRDEERYAHAHESPAIMTLPLVILAVFAVSVAWDFTYLGYAVIAATFFLARGFQQGWFKPSAHAHRHDDHGHDAHGHDDHAHGHAAHANNDHGHSAHGHATRGHDHHDELSAPPLTWSWTATMLLVTVLGGFVVQQGIKSRIDEQRPIRTLSLVNLLEDARPAGTLEPMTGHWLAWTWPNEHDSHAPAIKTPVTLLATGTWVGGILIAAAFFWWGYLSPEEVRRQFSPLYTLLWNKYYFDELYDAIFVKPTHVLARFMAGIDRYWIDWLIDQLGRSTVSFSKGFDVIADRGIVDGIANLTATWTYSLGTSLRAVQTGRIRQYVVFIVVGAVAIFVLISFFWSPSLPASSTLPASSALPSVPPTP